MPKTKKTVSKKIKHAMVDVQTEDLLTPLPEAAVSQSGKPRWGMVVAGIFLIALVYLGSKGYIVAAVVNGSPVFRWNINAMLVSRYGQQTLESMISEKLIADAAMKQGVAITQKDIDEKTSEIVKSLGPNVKLDDLLKYQGMNKVDFEHQVKLQLTVEKILGKDVVVSDSDISDFIVKNKETMVATDEAAMRGEARTALTTAKINEKIQPWFAQLKEKAKIVRLMK